MIAPLLAWPHLSASAAALRGTDELAVQYHLAGDVYDALRQDRAPRWGPAVMWRGCPGALLYWWGCLAAQMPQGAMGCPRYVQAWVDAYRASEMAVGPLPWWLGDTGFHLRCQSLLLAAYPTRFGGYFVHAPLDLAYLWPTEKENEWWMP